MLVNTLKIPIYGYRKERANKRNFVVYRDLLTSKHPEEPKEQEASYALGRLHTNTICVLLQCFINTECCESIREVLNFYFCSVSKLRVLCSFRICDVVHMQILKNKSEISNALGTLPAFVLC